MLTIPVSQALFRSFLQRVRTLHSARNPFILAFFQTFSKYFCDPKSLLNSNKRQNPYSSSNSHTPKRLPYRSSTVAACRTFLFFPNNQDQPLTQMHFRFVEVGSFSSVNGTQWKFHQDLVEIRTCARIRSTCFRLTVVIKRDTRRYATIEDLLLCNRFYRFNFKITIGRCRVTLGKSIGVRYF